MRIVQSFLTISIVFGSFVSCAPGQTNAQSGGSEAIQPANRIGPDDLLAITVFDSPALSRKVRVSADGHIDLPLLSAPLAATGLMPDALAANIAQAYQFSEILVHPSISVSVLQYSSRPVSVAGEVKHPVTFEVSGKVTLLNALTRADGLTSEAGPFVTVSRSESGGERSTMTIAMKDLMDGGHPDLNVELKGGEEIRIARAPKVFIMGNVRKPGSYFVQDSLDLSVLKIIALAEGLLPYTASEAYITRTAPDGRATQIPVDLRGLMDRKKPDVQLQGNDLLFVKDSKGRKATMNTIDRIAGFGTSTASGLVIWH
jgi:polysaccharide export outer membrane protein